MKATRKSKFVLRLAQAISVILGVAILAVVALMVYLGINKAREDRSVQPSPRVAAEPAKTHLSLPASCKLSASHADQGRLALIFDGPESDCRRMILLSLRDGQILATLPFTAEEHPQ